MSRRTRRRDRARGFTLLEVMIAVAIAAIGIVGLLELFGGSMRLGRASAVQTDAVVLASSLIDSVLWRAEFDEGEVRGDDGPFGWTVYVEAVDPTFGSTEEEPLEDISDDYELYEVTAEVYWSEGDARKSVVVKSRRIMERF